MTIRYPWFLLLLFLVPVLAWLRYRRSRKPALFFSDGETLNRLPLTWAIGAHRLLPFLHAAALVCIVIALARPQKGLEESIVRTEAVDIVLLVDVSTSMRAEDLTVTDRTMNRLDVAKEIIESFIEKRSHDRIAMVAFSAMPYSVSPLTLDKGWLVQRMKHLKTGMIEDGTAIGDAIASAVNRLSDSTARSKVVILLTDGMNNRGILSPENAAAAAGAIGIKVYTIGAGTDGVVRIPVEDAYGRKRYVRQRSEVDEQTLKTIADTTGAGYFRASDYKGLQEVYDQIDGMEKTEIDVEHYTRFEERFAPFALIALGLIALEKLLALTRLRRLP